MPLQPLDLAYRRIGLRPVDRLRLARIVRALPRDGRAVATEAAAVRWALAELAARLDQAARGEAPPTGPMVEPD